MTIRPSRTIGDVRLVSHSNDLRTFDLFCGAGGSSWGASLAGVRIVGAVDRDPDAVSNFRANFPNAAVWAQPAEQVDLSEVVERIGQVDVLLASPDCTSHTPARGRARRSEASKQTVLQVLRYAESLNPRWIVIENVIAMSKWWRYGALLKKLRREFSVSELKLNSADFGVPQARRRLFIVCDRQTEPPAHLNATSTDRHRAEEVVNLNGTYKFSPLRAQGRAQATLDRAERAIRSLGNDKPFLLVYYGSDGSGGWQSLDTPLRTITTVDRFALVKPGGEGHVMRMLQVPELLAAMGFTDTPHGRQFRLETGTRRDKIRLLGNAVCPPVMRAIVSELCDGEPRRAHAN